MEEREERREDGQAEGAPGPGQQEAPDDAGAMDSGVERPAGERLAEVRELILKAYPDVVAEMVAGESVDELLASIPTAREAYARVATTIQEQTPPPTPVPTGAGRRPPIDPDGLSPEGMIRAGLRSGPGIRE